MILNPYPGLFVAVDGIDGSGKSTLTRMLVDWLRLEVFPTPPDSGVTGQAVLETKEPNKDGPFGKLIYADLAQEGSGLHARNPMRFQELFACDSLINSRDNVIPHLAKGGIVVSDRCRASMVYGAMTQEQIKDLMAMNQRIIGESFIWPDIVFIVDVPADVAMERLKRSHRDFLDGHEQFAVLDRTRNNFRYLAREYPNCVLIPDKGDRSPESKLAFIQEYVQEFLKKRASRVVEVQDSKNQALWAIT